MRRTTGVLYTRTVREFCRTLSWCRTLTKYTSKFVRGTRTVQHETRPQKQPLEIVRVTVKLRVSYLPTRLATQDTTLVERGETSFSTSLRCTAARVQYLVLFPHQRPRILIPTNAPYSTRTLQLLVTPCLTDSPRVTAPSTCSLRSHTIVLLCNPCLSPISKHPVHLQFPNPRPSI